MTEAGSEPYPAPAHDGCAHLPAPLPPPGRGGRAGLSTRHSNTCKHKLAHQPAGRVLLSAGDIAYHVCKEKQHLLQDFPLRSSGEVLIKEGHVLWCDVAADTVRTARSERLLGFLKVTGDNFHSSRKRYCTRHEATLFWISLGWVKKN